MSPLSRRTVAALAISVALLALTLSYVFDGDAKALLPKWRGPIRGPKPPLPDDLPVVAPSPAIAEGAAAFSGRWEGVWQAGTRAVLIVQKVTSHVAHIVYGWGANPIYDLSPGYAYYVARIIHGKAPSLEWESAKLKFCFSMDANRGRIEGRVLDEDGESAGHIAMTRPQEGTDQSSHALLTDGAASQSSQTEFVSLGDRQLGVYGRLFRPRKDLGQRSYSCMGTRT